MQCCAVQSSAVLPDVLKEGEVEVLVLEPGQLQVTVHVGAVGVSVPGKI